MDNSSTDNNDSKYQVSNFFKHWLDLNRWVVVLYLVVIATAGVLYVGNVNDTTELLKNIRKLEHKIEDLENRKKIINSRVKRLQAPDRIITIGLEKLNMQLSDKAPLFLEDTRTQDE